jgi:hypothetical protein
VLKKVKDNSKDDEIALCDMIGESIAHGTGSILAEKDIEGLDLSLGPHQVETSMKKGRCNLKLEHLPNPTERLDAEVLADVKARLKEIVDNGSLLKYMSNKEPASFNHVLSVVVAGSGNDDVGDRVKSTTMKSSKSDKKKVKSEKKSKGDEKKDKKKGKSDKSEIFN